MIKDDHWGCSGATLAWSQHWHHVGVLETKPSSLDVERFNGHLMDQIRNGKAAAVHTHLTHTILITVSSDSH